MKIKLKWRQSDPQGHPEFWVANLWAGEHVTLEKDLEAPYDLKYKAYLNGAPLYLAATDIPGLKKLVESFFGFIIEGILNQNDLCAPFSLDEIDYIKNHLEGENDICKKIKQKISCKLLREG